MKMLPNHNLADGSKTEIKRRPHHPTPVNTTYRRSWPSGPYSPNRFKVKLSRF